MKDGIVTVELRARGANCDGVLPLLQACSLPSCRGRIKNKFVGHGGPSVMKGLYLQSMGTRQRL
jgi:hypothetical protein